MQLNFCVYLYSFVKMSKVYLLFEKDYTHIRVTKISNASDDPRVIYTEKAQDKTSSIQASKYEKGLSLEPFSTINQHV